MSLLSVLVKNAKPFRAMHYIALTVLGGLYALFLSPSALFNFKSMFASLGMAFFGFEFCLIYNNLHDKQIPKKVSREQYKKTSIVMLLFSLFFSLFTSFLVIAFLSLAIVIGLLYSIPPFRLKRLGFLNNLIIGLLSVLALGIGFLSQNPTPNAIPLNAVLAVFFTFSLASNIKDLKDYKTDKKQEIKTLPVILGKKKGLKAIAFLSSISFLIPPILLNIQPLIIPGAFLALLNFVLLNKTKKETITFTLYFLFTALFGFVFVL